MKKVILSLCILFYLFVPAHGSLYILKTEHARKKEKDPESVLIRGPYLQAASNSSIVIRWRTNVLERGVVRYGTSPDNLEFSAENTLISMEHIVTLRELKPDTRYYYSIGGAAHILQGNANNYFYTLPDPGNKGFYRIGFFGDAGNGSKNQKDIRDQFVKYLGDHYMNAWILLGDNAYEHGTDAQYQTNFFTVFQEEFLKKYPLYSTTGNHDYLDIEKYRGKNQKTREVAYFKNFTMPVNGEAGGVPSHDPSYFSFDIGNAHFVSLDSYYIEESGLRLYDTLSNQVQWMKKDLDYARKNQDWIVVFWHHPPYSMGGHSSDKEGTMVKLRENLVPIVERYGVDLVVGGHSHSYERSKLMKGHYGPESSFSEKYNLSHSSGSFTADIKNSPYIKESHNQGTVYVVTGSAGKLDSNTQPSWPHDAMPYSNASIGGAVMLEIDNNRMDLKWICADGVIRDQFTMLKNIDKKQVVKLKEGQQTTLKASYNGRYKWNFPVENTGRSIKVSVAAGKTFYMVKDENNCIREVFEVEGLKTK